MLRRRPTRNSKSVTSGRSTKAARPEMMSVMTRSGNCEATQKEAMMRVRRPRTLMKGRLEPNDAIDVTPSADAMLCGRCLRKTPAARGGQTIAFAAAGDLLFVRRFAVIAFARVLPRLPAGRQPAPTPVSIDRRWLGQCPLPTTAASGDRDHVRRVGAGRGCA